MKKIFVSALVIVAVFFLFAEIGFSHCQVPCGIYGDQLRFSMMEEDISTIEKAVNEINKLSQTPGNYNQLVRWINAKEDHANSVMKTASDYFIAQRIAIQQDGDNKDKNYCAKMSLLHKIVVYAMQTKQSVDLNTVEKLKNSVAEFKKIYFEKK
jgi:nickel superoxide dismutase